MDLVEVEQVDLVLLVVDQQHMVLTVVLVLKFSSLVLQQLLV